MKVTDTNENNKINVPQTNAGCDGKQQRSSKSIPSSIHDGSQRMIVIQIIRSILDDLQRTREAMHLAQLGKYELSKQVMLGGKI